MKRNLLLLIAIFLIISASVQADDYLHPSGYAINSTYSISDSVIVLGDTIIITRIITNNELFDLSNLYLSDNIPSDFQVINQMVEIDGSPVDFIFSGAQEDLIYPGYNTYHWTIDSPVFGESVNNLLHSGESLTIQYWAVSTDIGNYTYPRHLSSFIAQSEGYFISSDLIEVRVVISLGIDDDPEADNMLPNYINSTAYPNPFNPDVKIMYEGIGIGGNQIEFVIYNILGQKIHQETVSKGSNKGEFYWHTDFKNSSGVYFYKIITQNANTSGKLVLIK